MPTHFFRIKSHLGKQYLYKVWAYRENDCPYPKQKNQFIGNIERIKEVINNA